MALHLFVARATDRPVIFPDRVAVRAELWQYLTRDPSVISIQKKQTNT